MGKIVIGLMLLALAIILALAFDAHAAHAVFGPLFQEAGTGPVTPPLMYAGIRG
jgi:hypothetical protein